MAGRRDRCSLELVGVERQHRVQRDPSVEDRLGNQNVRT
jgi:hypothetical protein